MVHILDDFLFISSNFPSCKANLDQFMALCSTVGVPLKAEKTEQPKQVITFMGLELDSVTMEARLPMDKLVKLRSLLSSTSKSRKIKLKDLQSLLGLLNFCCQVIVPGRCFLRRLTDLTKKVSKPNHRITLTRESRKDIQAWLLFLQSFNGKQLLVEQRWVHNTALHLHTDASGNIGFGAIFGSHWLYSTWPPKLAHLHITYKELFPIVLALEIWGPLLTNKCIVLHTDNAAVVHIINRQTSKDKNIMHLVRRLVIQCMSHNILVKAEHIPGTINVLADLLSRFQVDKFLCLAPNMDRSPTVIPDHLLTDT